MKPGRALIVGAGIGGLAAGVALRRVGWQVRIHERAPSPGDRGFALSIAPNGAEALRELGIVEEVVARGVRTASFVVRRPEGTILRSFRQATGVDSAVTSVVALRSALHEELVRACGCGSLVTESEAVGFDEAADGVSLRLAGGAGDFGDILVGADGVASRIREALHPEEPAAWPSGYCAVRGIARGVLGELDGFDAAAYLGVGLEAGLAAAGGDSVYWYLSLLTRDVATTGDPAIIADVATRGLDARLRAVIDATKPEEMRLDELLQRAPLDRWGRGRVTLLGDAAHPFLPHTAQGAAQALEDAIALGLALADRSRDAPLALRRYEDIRSRRTARLIRFGPRIARTSTTRNRWVIGARNAAIRLVPTVLLQGVLTVRRDPHRALRPS